jgi:hypothetical protein
MKTSHKIFSSFPLTQRIAFGLGISLMVACNINCFGQDTLIKNDGTRINGKVLEISPKEVKYKKDPDGPLYIESVSDLSEIKYSNGISDTFKFIKPWLKPILSREYREQEKLAAKKKPDLHKMGSRYLFKDNFISESEMQDYLLTLNDPAINEHIHSAKLQRIFQHIGFVAIPFGVASLFCFIQDNSTNGYGPEPGANSNNYQNSKILAFAGVACIGTSICLKVKRSQNNAKAIKLYNQKF